MKRQRILFKCLAFLFFGLFLILTLYGGYSVATYGNRWFSSNKNPRVRAQKESVIAGDIYDRNGVLLATTDENGNRVYQASEQARRAVVHLLGDSQRNVANGVESFQTAYLYGFHSSFGELLGDFFSGTARRGDNLYLTIDSRLCQRMIESYQNHSSTSGKSGAAVVMNYLTGEILAEISLPTFDPLQVTAGVDADGEPFWNRATQSVYPPGSTFKIVTAASALKYLPELAEEEFECTGDLQLNGHTIHDYGNTVHGRMDLKEAFSVSCNNIFAALAVELTDARLRQTAENSLSGSWRRPATTNWPRGCMSGCSPSTHTATPPCSSIKTSSSTSATRVCFSHAHVHGGGRGRRRRCDAGANSPQGGAGSLRCNTHDLGKPGLPKGDGG